MPIERYQNRPIFRVNELTGEPVEESNNRKYYSDPGRQLWSCWAIKEIGPHDSVILGCAIYKDSKKAQAEKRLKALNRHPKPGHSFELVHLEPNEPYEVSSEWGHQPMRVRAKKIHCVNDGRTCR